MNKQAISISIKEKKEMLEYTVRWKNKPTGEEMMCKSFEFPRPELLEALENCGEYIPLICGIPKDHITRIIVAGATFLYTKENKVYGVVFGVSLIMTCGRVLDLKTPEMGIRVNNPDLDKSTMWEDRLTKQVMTLHDEIILYAEGRRGQTSLNFEEGEINEICKENGAESGEESE